MSSARVHARVPEKLKNRVDSKLEGSSLTYSSLVEGALENFLSQYDEEVECGSCNAVFHVNALVKTDGKCPNCSEEV